jgi:hypothetical protein
MSDFIKEGFNGPGKDYPDEASAKRARDARARELRKAGYTVTCAKFSFQDLARASRFTLEAKRGA